MDKKALRILNKTFWKNGWTEGDSIEEKIKLGYLTQEEFDYAKEKGLMFDAFSITHDECMDIIAEFFEKVNIDILAKVFLCSLSTRRLYLRSAFASYFYLKDIPVHSFEAVKISGGIFCGNGEPREIFYEYCKKCIGDGGYGNIHVADEEYHNEDLNVLNFERIKWGGVRHGELLYCTFDMREFLKIIPEIGEPTEEDISLFKLILKAIDESLPKDTPRKLEKRIRSFEQWKKLSSKNEIDVLMEILEQIGILKPAKIRNVRKGDFGFVENWIGEDGYQKEVVNKLFGKYL